MSYKSFLGSLELGCVLADLRMTCLDIGARRGFTEDLLPLAPAVDACGFEPDLEECQRLNQAAARDSRPWRSLRFIPTALGQEKGSRTLNLYHKRGCSSFLEANVGLADMFSRAQYYQLDDTVDVHTMPLDTAAVEYDFTDAVFMKIDVQGAELEVLNSGPRLLSQALLVIRAEVSFVPLYQGQPLYCEIDSLLRSYGFLPMRFLESHHWRHTTRRKHPHLAEGGIPYSRGQIVHGDMLYFHDPERIVDDPSWTVQKLLKAAFIALAYEHVDYAWEIFTRSTVAQYLRSTYGFEPIEALSEASRYLYCQYRRTQWRRLWRSAKGWLRRRLSDVKV